MRKLLAAVALLASPLPAQAAQIVLNPGNVYASTGDYSALFAADNIFDQQTGAIDESAQDGSYWLNPDNGPAAAAISIDLGQQYRLGSFDLFNTHNAFYDDRGTGAFSIVGSNDASFASFVTLASGTLAPESQGTPLTAQSFASASNGMFRYLQFRPTSVATRPNGIYASPCCGANVYGLNELRVFDAAAAVPEAGTWAMMILGFGVAGALGRRRRRIAFA